MKKKYRIITILLTVVSITIATRILISRSDLNLIKEKSGQVSGRAIRERLRPLQVRHNKLSLEEKGKLSRMIRQDKPGPKKLEQLKKEYNKLPAQEQSFLYDMVKVYPIP